MTAHSLVSWKDISSSPATLEGGWVSRGESSESHYRSCLLHAYIAFSSIVPTSVYRTTFLCPCRALRIILVYPSPLYQTIWSPNPNQFYLHSLLKLFVPLNSHFSVNNISYILCVCTCVYTYYMLLGYINMRSGDLCPILLVFPCLSSVSET